MPRSARGFSSGKQNKKRRAEGKRKSVQPHELRSAKKKRVSDKENVPENTRRAAAVQAEERIAKTSELIDDKVPLQQKRLWVWLTYKAILKLPSQDNWKDEDNLITRIMRMSSLQYELVEDALEQEKRVECWIYFALTERKEHIWI